ncbi:hypothetical protein [Streptomyces asoensis]|uniref:hypothetical protein n=1 Tax=Streptomyces asoensis TaxID=249586 RepID=UPI0033E7E2D2
MRVTDVSEAPSENPAGASGSAHVAQPVIRRAFTVYDLHVRDRAAPVHSSAAPAAD